MIEMLSQEPSAYVDDVKQRLIRVKNRIAHLSEQEAGKYILQLYVGTYGSFNEFYIPAGTARDKRFSELKQMLYSRGRELLGGEDVSEWYSNRGIISQPTNPSPQIALLVVAGMILFAIVWWLTRSSFLALLLGLIHLLIGWKLLSPYYISPWPLIFAVFATVFAFVFSLIIVSQVRIW